jgi:hypothetical protein
MNWRPSAGSKTWPTPCSLLPAGAGEPAAEHDSICDVVLVGRLNVDISLLIRNFRSDQSNPAHHTAAEASKR